MELPARVYAQIDLDAICQNIQTAMQKVGADTKVMAIIKTDAYGHGAVPVAKALRRIGTYAFGVATAEEAVQLRKNGIDNPMTFGTQYFNMTRQKRMPRAPQSSGKPRGYTSRWTRVWAASVCSRTRTVWRPSSALQRSTIL